MSALKPESCLESCLAVPIRRFIQLRQLSGTDYHTQALLLFYFDRFLVAQKVTGSQLTRQIVEAYEKTLSRRSHCSVQRPCRHMKPTCSYSDYLSPTYANHYARYPIFAVRYSR